MNEIKTLMTFDPASELQKAFEEHGIRSKRDGRIVSVPESDFVASAVVVSVERFPGAVLSQLDIRVESRKLPDRLLIESFAGFGLDESEALRDAFAMFLKASLHVLLATLIDAKHGAYQVEWDSWSLHGKTWRVCIGPILQHGSSKVAVKFSNLLNRLKDEFADLSNEPHWLRVFFMMDSGKRLGGEVRLDNFVWSEGQQILDAWEWPDENFRVRNFLIAVPDAGQVLTSFS